MLLSGGVDPTYVDKHFLDTIGVSPFYRSMTVESYAKRKGKHLFNLVAERVKRMIAINYPSTSLLGTHADIFKNFRPPIDRLNDLPLPKSSLLHRT
jgi:hypothetical protein